MLAEVILGVETNWVDITSLVILLGFFIYGAVRGFLIQLAGIAVLVGALILGGVLSTGVGQWMHERWETLNPITARWIAFVTIGLLVLIIGTWLARMLKGALKRAQVLAYDRLLGGLLGGLKGLIILVVLVYVFLAFSQNKDDEKIQGISKDIVESRTMRIAEWSTEKVLVFLPQDMREWVSDHTGQPSDEG